MNLSYIKKDILRNKIIHLALVLFMIFSSWLASLSLITAFQTYTSMTSFYAIAQPPHFVQMHKGPIDIPAIDSFMANHEQVIDSHVSTMITIYGENITIKNATTTFDLSDCLLDIGFVKQNPRKDLLLNAKHENVILQTGQIGIPVLLTKMYDITIGDTLILNQNGIQKEFTIAQIILDAQMNSTMASSTRVLLSENDFDKLVGIAGEREYLIEAYLANSNDAGQFQTDYQDAGLAMNGQAVTYTMLFLLGAFTDIITVFVLLLVSVLLILVSFLCVSYTIMAALEEEITNIGTMKAIGLPNKEIQTIYLQKYRFLALIGSIIGYLVALMTSSFFTKHINETFGQQNLSLPTMMLAALASAIVYITIVSRCKKTLKKIKSVSIVDALIHKKGFDNTSYQHGTLFSPKQWTVNWQLAYQAIRYRFKQQRIVFMIVFVASIMMLIPANLLQTFKSPEFITYMGSSLEDILIEVENGALLEQNYQNVMQLITKEDSIQQYDIYRSVRVKTPTLDGQMMNLDIDSGNRAGQGLQYTSGHAPTNKQEIAISMLNANELAKQAGDTIQLYIDQAPTNFLVSGIYQDVTSGGLTAKATYDFPQLKAHKYSLSIDLKDNIDIPKTAQTWKQTLGSGVNVDPMEDFIQQTLGGVINQLETLVIAIVVIATALAMLITVLFLKLRLAKDVQEIATMKAIGFSQTDITQQYLIRVGVVALLGITLGTLTANLLGESIVSAALGISSLGIRQVNLLVHPLMNLLVCPLLLLSTILLVTKQVMKSIAHLNMVAMIRE